MQVAEDERSDKVNSNSMLDRTNHTKKLDICQWFCIPFCVLNQSVILMYRFSSHQYKSFILHNSILHIREFTLGNSRKFSKTNLKIA
jgi:hypothetical protein